MCLQSVRESTALACSPPARANVAAAPPLSKAALFVVEDARRSAGRGRRWRCSDLQEAESLGA